MARTNRSARAAGTRFERGGEEWLPVLGYEDAYEVSNQGRVRSIDRVVGNRHLKGTPENTFQYKSGGRQCRACGNERRRRSRAA